MKHFSSRIKGFTLIELLVVIAIIILLTGIILSNLTASKGKSRDAKRVSDVGQIQLALAFYFDRCRAYPISIADTSATNGPCPSGISLASYIAQIPKPTSEKGQANYDYVTNSASNPTNYVIRAILESNNASSPDSLSDTNKQPSGDTWANTITCHNSASDTNYCVGPK